MDNKQIYDEVSRHYSTASKGNDLAYGQAVAKEFGYSLAELESIPQDSNLGLSCGNPTAIAKLKEGETVVDLGSGAGFDIFLAAKKIGANGKAIGIDYNKDMLQRANQIKEKTHADNTSFVESSITKIALEDGVADCIISNCVVNLVPEEDKQLVFNETFRVLKSGGRVAFSDILARKEMPQELRDNMALYVGCISSASLVKDYEKYLHTAGFRDTLIVDAKSDLNIYTTAATNGQSNGCCGPAPVAQVNGCCGPAPSKQSNGCCGPSSEESATAGEDASASKVKDLDFNEFAGSFKIYALKP